MEYSIFPDFSVILIRRAFIFILITFCLIRAGTDQIGLDPDNPIPDEDIALMEEILLFSPKNQKQLIQKLSELSLLTEQDVSLLKESKAIFELLKDPQASETLIIILTQIEKQKPGNNYNGWIKKQSLKPMIFGTGGMGNFNQKIIMGDSQWSRIRENTKSWMDILVLLRGDIPMEGGSWVIIKSYPVLVYYNGEHFL